jgi:2,4-diketo-3-deoxy-L-fuconate hydrolase
LADSVFHLGTFANPHDPFPGLVVSGRVIDLRPFFGERATVVSLLADWDASLERLGHLAAEERDGVCLERLRALPPVHPPRTYLCAGANYRRHVIQMMVNQRDAGSSEDAARAEAERSIDDRAANGVPFMFVGLPNAVSGAYDDVVLPAQGAQNDWELELTIVIGKEARAVGREQAMDHVAGYTITNDISARDRMLRRDLPMTDFLNSKCRPTFKPTGPYITPKQFVPDPHDLRITLKVNGEVMQDDTTSDMIFGVERLVEYVSGVTDLYPGDMILTGSPSGNAAHHGNRFLQPGDLIEGEISRLGVQRNRCVAATATPKGPDDSVAYQPLAPR